MAEIIKEMNEILFESEVIGSSFPVLVDFWAPWCRPCKMIVPVLEEYAKEQVNRLKIVKVNVDEHPNLASRFDVRGIPTLILFKDGQAVDNLVGFISKQALTEKMSPYI